jgi:phospholipase D-like protein
MHRHARLRDDDGMARLFALFALADLALLVVALIDCLSTDTEKVRALPKFAWVLLIILFSPFAPVAWFLAGRPARPSAARRAGHPAGTAVQPPRRPLAPDDDPEFLRQLSARTRKSDEDAVRKREADLRRREEERRRRDQAGEAGPGEG